nr:MAG TPA: hypothetical protein [Caudoviricetes sp.]
MKNLSGYFLFNHLFFLQSKKHLNSIIALKKV